MEKRKTDSPCNLDFFLNTKRWELLTSPLSSLYSFKKKENRTCFLVHKQKRFPSPCPIFSYLKFRMNVSLVRRWGSSERKVCKAQNKSLFEGQTGWAISSKGIYSEHSPPRLPMADDFSEDRNEAQMLKGGIMKFGEWEITCKYQSEMDQRWCPVYLRSNLQIIQWE